MQENACSGDNQVYEFDYDERMAAQPREEALDSPALRYGSNQEVSRNTTVAYEDIRDLLSE